MPKGSEHSINVLPLSFIVTILINHSPLKCYQRHNVNLEGGTLLLEIREGFLEAQEAGAGPAHGWSSPLGLRDGQQARVPGSSPRS